MPPRFGGGRSVCASAGRPDAASAADGPTNVRGEIEPPRSSAPDSFMCSSRSLSLFPALEWPLATNSLNYPGSLTILSRPGSQPEHRFGENVVLTFAGAAVDRHLAVVQVGRGCKAGPIRRDGVDAISSLH